MKYLLTLLMTIMLPITGLCSDERIEWYYADFPPCTIARGESKGSGFGDMVMKTLQTNLHEYEHTSFEANFSRIIKQLGISNGCCVTLLKTPARKKILEFSQPVIVGLPCGVCILESRLAEFKPFIDKSGYISINRLFEESDMKMGISSGRKYMKAVDDIITRAPNSPKIIKSHDKNVSREHIIALAAGRRVDYVIEYPEVLSWISTHENITNKMKYIPIREADDYIVAYVGCTKNAWGKRVINRINTIINNKYLEGCKERYQDFLAPEDIKRHNEFAAEVFPE
ncbi:TIGR02285 family protein [Maridesulfovibrio sp.]|uniref:TIGR02285 family protein n=1 Tax=Maridesulfovibrio sp. TaxID=2795000 RepID=UPI002A18DC0B|nr:TIGR02285 family protein [Maridesulfovibrio sp.]